MLTALLQLNWLSVLVASVASFLLGGLWFTALFAKPYAFALGRERAEKEKPKPIYMIGPLACGVVTTITSACLIRTLGIDSLPSALGFGAWVGGGYMAATTVNTAINPNIPRPLFYGLVSGSYFFLAGMMSSAILVAMR
jgi:Protein of unknown function (DUF1761)